MTVRPTLSLPGQFHVAYMTLAEKLFVMIALVHELVHYLGAITEVGSGNQTRLADPDRGSARNGVREQIQLGFGSVSDADAGTVRKPRRRISGVRSA